MSFIGEMINEFTHQGQGSGQRPQGNYGGGGGQQQSGPPQVQPPWVARWDNNRGTWFYINEQTGQEMLDHPSGGGYGGNQGYSGQQGYGGNRGPGGNQGYYGNQGYGGGGPGPGPGYGGNQGYSGQQQPQQQQSHKSGYGGMAMGAAAGLVGGAALMYGAHEIHEDYDEDKYRVENDVDRAEGWAGRKVEDGVQDVQDFPEDAAGWAGRKVGEVEDIPEDVAGWTGRKVGDVERFGDDIEGDFDGARNDVDRFGDNMDSAYDQGRADGRDDDY